MSNIIKPNRFISLHAHTGFSTYDGLGYPQEHIDFVIENGMDGWCLTDHGHMNAFAHAYFHAKEIQKKHPGFKFVPGCEMYVHPDLDVWKIDMQLKQAARDGDAWATKKLMEKREAIATPLTAIVDSDDEIVDLAVEEAGLTIENEEETKSAKFYDPVKRRHHLVVLPRTNEGLRRLFSLVSKGYMEGFYKFPRIDYKMLKEAAEGGHLLVSTACIGGACAWEVFKHAQELEFDELKHNLLDDPSFAKKVIAGVGNTYDALADAVGRENTYLELQFNKLPAQHLVNRALIEFAKESGIEDKLVVTTDSHYARPEHWKEREIYKQLGWLNFRNFNPNNLPESVDDLKCELYPKNHEQVWDTFLSTAEGMDFYDPEIIKNAIERPYDIVHNDIQVIEPDTRMKLPSYVVPKEKTDDQALIDACKQGLIDRGLAEDSRYIDRLKYEISIIKEKQFSRYFLTMKAIIDIAKEQMLIGSGRGSAAGSLVAYVLGITEIDPLDYDLMFERFLNPSREGAPDIDTDVEDRDMLINMLKERWGDENIVPISNYNTFKLKSLVKDIARFYNIPFDEVNTALGPVERDVKKAVFSLGSDKNLFVLTYEDALEHSESFRGFIEKYPEVAEPIQVLFKQNRSLGRHAGGCIIAENIPNQMPLIKAKDEIQTPWVEGMNYKHLESLGWIKFDLLGLETLRMIHRTIELILKRHHGINNPTFAQVKEWFDINMSVKKIDLNDQHVYKHVYEEGRFAGIFQLANEGAQKLFMRAKPKNIIDIATLTSIYRPGPLTAHVDKLYVKAKNNPSTIDYGHPLIKQVLEPTSGMIIFQEQIMRLCSVVAGFPEADTDNVRRSLMKRKASEAGKGLKEAESLKKKFVEGAVKNGVREQVADDLYEKILYFAGYGFNAAHAVSYAIDSYWCAWLLTYYEEEWLCAYLESMSTNDEKRAKAFGEARKLGYKIVPIDINYAEKGWTILEGKRFMPSFSSCKSVGDVAVEEIMQNRPYNSIEELLWNEDGTWKHQKFNKKTLEALVKIRAFDSMDMIGPGKTFESYKQLHHVVVENMPQLKKRLKREPNYGQNALYRLIEESQNIGEWDRQEIAENLMTYLASCNASTLIPDEILDHLEEVGINSLDTYNGEDIYWFVVMDSTPRKTKTGKQYLLLSGAGEDGLPTKIYLWSWSGKPVQKYSVCVAEVKQTEFGFSTQQRKLKILNV